MGASFPDRPGCTIGARKPLNVPVCPAIRRSCRDHIHDPPARGIVRGRVDHQALPCAGDLRQHGGRVRSPAPAAVVASGSERLHARAIAGRGVHDRQKGRMHAVLHHRPVDEAGGGDLVGPRRHPQLAPQVGHEDVALDERSHRTVEQRLPRRAGQERGHEIHRVRHGLRHRPGAHWRHRLLDAEHEVPVRAERQEVVAAADARELGLSQQFNGDESAQRGQVERGRLRITRKIARRRAACPARRDGGTRAPFGSNTTRTRCRRGPALDDACGAPISRFIQFRSRTGIAAAPPR